MRMKTDNMIQFCRYHLNNEKQPRDDYRECLELVLVALGARPESDNYNFKLPGAFHKARWMALVLYTIKIFLFREQLGKSPAEKKKLESFEFFVCFVYIEHWVLCTRASDASIMDLRLFQHMVQLKAGTRKNLANAVINKFLHHTWWLNQEYIPFSLFSDLISNRQKQMIADQMLQIPPNQDYSIGYPNPVPLKTNYREAMQYEIADFVGYGSLFLFEVLGFDKEW